MAMLARVAALPTDRCCASAFRRFPPGCGRHNKDAAGPGSLEPLSSSATKPPLPNPPSPAPAATKTTEPSLKRRTLPAPAPFSGVDASDRGVGDGRKAAATAPRTSAERSYPPGCGRGVAVSKASACEASEVKPTEAVCNGEAKAIQDGRKAEAATTAPRASAVRRYPPGCGKGLAVSKATEVVCNGEATDRACNVDAALCLYAPDHGGSEISGATRGGGNGDAVAQEGSEGKPWVVTGLMAVPFLPWAKQGRRSRSCSPAEGVLE